MFLALALVLAADPTVTPAAAATEEKQICRWPNAATGSNMPGKKECHTKAEWKAIAKANRENADRYKRDRAQGNGMPNLKNQ